jgi:hypothetical protein
MGRPGIVMSQSCVNLTWLPSGKFIINCFIPCHMLLTGVPSIVNIPSICICYSLRFAIVIALRYFEVGAPNKCLAVAANDCQEASRANNLC